MLSVLLSTFIHTSSELHLPPNLELILENWQLLAIGVPNIRYQK